MLEKYKVDLTSLEKSIEENQRIVDLFDLESDTRGISQELQD